MADYYDYLKRPGDPLRENVSKAAQGYLDQWEEDRKRRLQGAQRDVVTYVENVTMGMSLNASPEAVQAADVFLGTLKTLGPLFNGLLRRTMMQKHKKEWILKPTRTCISIVEGVKVRESPESILSLARDRRESEVFLRYLSRLRTFGMNLTEVQKETIERAQTSFKVLQGHLDKYVISH